jgi:hypothetical protein
MRQSLSADAFVAAMPPGRAIYAQRQVSGEDWQVAFLIRETSDRLAQMPRDAKVHVRAGGMQQGDVLVVIVIVCVEQGRYGDELYETWWNVHQPAGGLEMFQRMGQQTTLRLWFYGDTGEVERVLELENGLRAFFQSVMAVVPTIPAWTMAAFDAARASIERLFPSTADLWNIFLEHIAEKK